MGDTDPWSSSDTQKGTLVKTTTTKEKNCLPHTSINVARHDGIQLVRLFAQLLGQRLDVCNRMQCVQCVITHIIILLSHDSIIVVV
jgi:hypothetical protein